MMIPRSALVFLLLCCLPFAVVLADDCDTVDIRLYQDGDEIAQVEPIQTAESVQEFYAYDGTSFQGNYRLPLSGLRSVVAVHQDTNTCQLSLVVVHSAEGQGHAYGAVKFYFNGDMHNPTVKDDPEFRSDPFTDDSWDDIFERREGWSKANWYFPWTDTDGMAQQIVSDFVEDDGCIQIDPVWDVGVFAGAPVTFGALEEWVFVPDDDDTIDLDMDEVLSICFGDGRPRRPGRDPFYRERSDGACAKIGVTHPTCGMCATDEFPQRPVCGHHYICTIQQDLNCLFDTGFVLPP